MLETADGPSAPGGRARWCASATILPLDRPQNATSLSMPLDGGQKSARRPLTISCHWRRVTSTGWTQNACLPTRQTSAQPLGTSCRIAQHSLAKKYSFAVLATRGAPTCCINAVTHPPATRSIAASFRRNTP